MDARPDFLAVDRDGDAAPKGEVPVREAGEQRHAGERREDGLERSGARDGRGLRGACMPWVGARGLHGGRTGGLRACRHCASRQGGEPAPDEAQPRRAPRSSGASRWPAASKRGGPWRSSGPGCLSSCVLAIRTTRNRAVPPAWAGRRLWAAQRCLRLSHPPNHHRWQSTPISSPICSRFRASDQ